MSGEVLVRESFAVGQVIFNAGEPPRFAYIIQSGSVEISTLRDGKDVVLGVLGPGDLFGEMALVDALPRSATATAREATTCVVMRASEFQKRVESSDPIVRALLKMLTARLRKADG